MSNRNQQRQMGPYTESGSTRFDRHRADPKADPYRDPRTESRRQPGQPGQQGGNQTGNQQPGQGFQTPWKQPVQPGDPSVPRGERLVKRESHDRKWTGPGGETYREQHKITRSTGGPFGLF